MHESLDHDQSLAGGPRLVPAVATSDDLRDRALIARVAAGDELAFEQLVRLHRPRLLRIAERVVDAGRAEDAVQIALLRAYQSFSGGEIPRQPSAWLSAITRNAAIDQQRRRGPVDPVAEPGRDASSPSVASIAESRAELRDVLRDVAALPEHEREALLMRATVGAGHEAIGAQLSVSPGQARQLLHRARRRLREVAAVLLPAWLAFRVSQARAAVTTLAAAPSETVLSTKGAALALAAAATVGGGGAALQATRATDRSAPAETTSQPARGSSAAGASSSGAAPAVAATASGATSTSTVSSREAGDDRPGAGTADARDDARDDAPRDPGSTTHAPGAASHPSTTTGASHPGDDDDRRPERGTSSSGSGSSGSSRRDDDEDDDRGTAGGTSNSGSSGSGRDEDDRDDDRDSGSGSGSGSQSTAKAEDSSTSGKREPDDSSSSSDGAKVEDRVREQDDDRSDDEPDERSGRSAEDE